MVSAVVDRGNGGPWEWRTPGMADPNHGTCCLMFWIIWYSMIC